MKDVLLSAAIGDICGVPYEFDYPTKNYDDVDLLHPESTYSDDTVLTFACAEALLHHTDMAEALHRRGREDFHRGFGGRFRRWLMNDEITPAYNSLGNGSAMRCSAAGFLATTEEEAIQFATETALPTHNHPEGIKGAVATALAIFYARSGKGKAFIRQQVLNKYYPDWADRTYADILPDYGFDETCPYTVPAALICFLESHGYADCITLAIALGGDADTLAAIAGPMAYAHSGKMPQSLIRLAKQKLPKWMLDLNEEMNERTAKE